MPGPTQPGRQILLDDPTARPALGYDQIGRAFATIISQSEPRFAIGIFGGWGSGKTTLMRAIKAALTGDSLVVVDFNAWRFEREPKLLLPLLDTVRAALIRWSEPRDVEIRQKVRAVANRIGRVVRALATGLSAEVGVAGVATIGYDVGAALEAISPPEEPETAQSLYVAAFQELERAFKEFSAGGVTRVVVFVDDLDRCLPSNALDVLESMKLFFDLPGFVFVVGLDETIVERAIRAKFYTQEESRQGSGETVHVGLGSQRLGREYVKKIFQVPYSLPPMVPQQLDDLLESMYRESRLDDAQLNDMRNRVRPYLEYVAIERRVNPREVKRFINAYTLQTLIRPELDPDTVLALQTLAFRYEWILLYDAIFSDSAAFIAALREYRRGEDSPLYSILPSDMAAIPASLEAYLRSSAAEPLVRYESLDTYLSSLQATRGRDSTVKGGIDEAWAAEAHSQLNDLAYRLRNFQRLHERVPGQGITLENIEELRFARVRLHRTMSSINEDATPIMLVALPARVRELEQVLRAMLDEHDMDRLSEVSAKVNDLMAAISLAHEELNRMI